MMALFHMYLITAGLLFLVVIIYQWGKLDHRMKQLWGTAALLVCVVEQMGNQFEKMDPGAYLTPLWILVMLILLDLFGEGPTLKERKK